MNEIEGQQMDSARPEPRTAGERLRAAREVQGLTVKDVADRTRISIRQIEAIEAGDFGALSGRTYAIGFSRSYARLLGLDAEALVNQVRAELEHIQPAYDPHQSHVFEPGDPARVPSRSLAWLLALAALILLVGGYAFYRTFVAPAGSYPSLVAEEEAAPVPAPAETSEPAPPPAGQVVFTALEDGIWVKFYDADGRQLMQKQMARGESYAVPADAQGPQIWTGRPDALAITIGGRPVPKLADVERVMRDVPVSAEALLARPPAPTASGSPAPSQPTT